MLARHCLMTDLRKLGVIPGDMVMLHVSLRAVGKILGGPDEIHQAIMNLIAPHGTLMMYVGCEPEFEMIRTKHTMPGDEYVLEHCPPFDPATARARHDYGTLAEFLRSWPGTISSTNPGARIAALGQNSIWLTADHPLNYGYGPNSPLAKLYSSQGKLLLMGSDLDQVTLLHFAEHIAPIKEKRIRHLRVPLLKNHQKVWVDLEEFDTSVGIRKWPHRYFEKIMLAFFDEYKIKPSKVGNAESYLIDANALVDFAVPIMVKDAQQYPV